MIANDFIKILENYKEYELLFLYENKSTNIRTYLSHIKVLEIGEIVADGQQVTIKLV